MLSEEVEEEEEEKVKGKKLSATAKEGKMFLSPTSLTECVREWEDLEKNYQQIQVNRPVCKFTSA